MMFMLITLLNDGTLMCIGYDNTFPAPRPQRWNLKALFVVASVLALVAMISSLLLLWMALDANDACPSCYEKSWFRALGLPSIHYGQIITMIYLKVSISDFLTLFSARTRDKWFFSYPPSRILLGGACFALGTSSLVATFWPDGTSDGIPTIGLAHGDVPARRYFAIWVWLWCIVWWFIQDAAKVATYWIMERYDIFKFRSLGEAPADMAGRLTEKLIQPEHNSRGSNYGSIQK
jgi:H+-transporting ATPase